MTLITRIDDELKEAMRARDAERRDALRLILSSLKSAEKELQRPLSDDACLARWRRKIGADDVVLVDRPGRGYGDDYSPWLVEAPVGELVRVRGGAVTEEGILAA